MKTTLRVIAFGIVSGLIWSAVAIWCSARTAQVYMEFPVAGIITGLLISFALYKPLLRVNRRGTLFLGILALPIGAFCFGVCWSLIPTLVRFYDGANVSFGEIVLGPFYGGVIYAYGAIIVSLFSYYGLILFPSAVLTTYLLRWTIRHKDRPHA